MKKILQVLMVFLFLLSGAGSAFGLALAGQVGPDGTAPGVGPDIFLPLVQWFGGQDEVTGRVLGANNEGLAGVTVVSSTGAVTQTGQDGRYMFTNLPSEAGIAAVKDGFVFQPAMRLIAQSENEQGMDFKAFQVPGETIVNGDFETPRVNNNVPGWTLAADASAYAPVYYNDTQENHFMRMGTASAPGVPGLSEIRQKITIDENVTSAVLNLLMFPVYGQPPLPVSAGSAAAEAETTWMEAEEGSAAAADTDVQYIAILGEDEFGELFLLDYLYYDVENGEVFEPVQFDLAGYAGQIIWLAFGVYNDGDDRAAALFIDDVSLVIDSVIPPGTPALACDNGLVNSNFENQRTSWTLANAHYDDDLAHKGIYSMRTGILNRGNDANQRSYAWQSATIPEDIDHAMLRMWVYTQVDGVAPAGAQVQAESVPAGYRPGMGLPFTPENQPESVVADDTQYVLIVEPGTGEVLDTVMWSQYDNKRAWEFVEFNLLKYRGETILIYFGTDNVNNGVASAMFADEVVVELCDLDTGTPTATPTTPPTATAVPSVTPTAIVTGTVTPACNIDAIVNNGFERDTGWGIPITEFSAGYTTEKERQGAWSMRTGIPFTNLNRYSYSDFYQVVSVPDEWDQALLRFWYYPRSTEALAVTGADQVDFSASALEYSNLDLQYVLVLDRFGNWIDTIMWERSNLKEWTAAEIDLSDYLGQTVRLQWGVYNNGYGGITTMWVDDVELTPCD